MLDKIIKNVLELPGVEGACILDKKGVILHNALPDFFLDDFLEDLSRRIIALYEAVDENYVPCDDYLLKYPQKYIQLRRNRNVYLLVAVDPNVNLVSLRMVTNLVLKHITPKALSLLRAALDATPAVEAPVSPKVEQPPAVEASVKSEVSEAQSAVAASVATPDGAKPQRVRYYRGVKYHD
jgi:predicted regulator of Ras-like GTPase activity (Roadblock/LC7/MglB family)